MAMPPERPGPDVGAGSKQAALWGKKQHRDRHTSRGATWGGPEGGVVSLAEAGGAGAGRRQEAGRERTPRAALQEPHPSGEGGPGGTSAAPAGPVFSGPHVLSTCSRTSARSHHSAHQPAVCSPLHPYTPSQKGARAHTSPSWDTSRWKQNKSCFHVGSPEEPDAPPRGGLNRAPHLASRLRTRHRRGTQPATPQLDGGSATRGHRSPAATEARPSPRRRLPHPSVITSQASSSPTQSLREGCSWAS